MKDLIENVAKAVQHSRALYFWLPIKNITELSFRSEGFNVNNIFYHDNELSNLFKRISSLLWLVQKLKDETKIIVNDSLQKDKS